MKSEHISEDIFLFETDSLILMCFPWQINKKLTLTENVKVCNMFQKYDQSSKSAGKLLPLPNFLN